MTPGGAAPYKKGRAFEQAYARALRARGYTVARTAGSKSPWDLIGVIHQFCGHFQLKKTMGCTSAERLAGRLQMDVPPYCAAVAVHERDGNPCEHGRGFPGWRPFPDTQTPPTPSEGER